MRRPRPSARPPLAKPAPLLMFCSGFLETDNALAPSTADLCFTMPCINNFHSVKVGCAMSNEESLKEVVELLHELKLELVAEMDYASLELQVEAIIDKVYALTEGSD